MRFQPASRRLLEDGRRLHLHHGPIDLVIEAFGRHSEINRAYGQAWTRFETVLEELTAELTELRKPVSPPQWQPRGSVAVRMMEAVWPHRDAFVTPMAAVAGAVADEILRALTDSCDLEKAYVNNSGDIAVKVSPGEALRLGVVGLPEQAMIDGTAVISAGLGVGGIATSGWRGRSLSLGIADAVTVLACNAAVADGAATLIANAVNVDHPAIERVPANELDEDSDLGNRLVTTAVGQLEGDVVCEALDMGETVARTLVAKGLIRGVLMILQGASRAVGGFSADLPPGVIRSGPEYLTGNQKAGGCNG